MNVYLGIEDTARRVSKILFKAGIIMEAEK